MAEEYIKFDGARLNKVVEESAFSKVQISAYLRKNPTYCTQALSRGTMPIETFHDMCRLLGVNVADYLIIPKEETPETVKPAGKLAVNDAGQNWMVNVYRALEDVNDSINQNTSIVSDAIKGGALRS